MAPRKCTPLKCVYCVLIKTIFYLCCATVAVLLCVYVCRKQCHYLFFMFRLGFSCFWFYQYAVDNRMVKPLSENTEYLCMYGCVCVYVWQHTECTYRRCTANRLKIHPKSTKSSISSVKHSKIPYSLHKEISHRIALKFFNFVYVLVVKIRFCKWNVSIFQNVA